jgi:class 3 adenylate cyclase
MSRQEYRLAVILSAQVVGFDRMFEEDGETALEALDYLNELIPRLSEGHRGRSIRTVRDSYLLEFPTTQEAMRCALEIQEALATSALASGGRPPALRMGVHLGDIHFLENDAVGEGIAIASELQGKATPGGICISQEVYNAVAGRIEGRVVDRGTIGSSGGPPIHVYEFPAKGHHQGVRGGAGGPGGGPRVYAEATAEPGAAEAEAERPPSEDFEELKGLVLDQLKRMGRRVSAEKLKSMIPARSYELHSAIDKLADMGFISRERGAPGLQPPQAPQPPLSRGRYDREEWRELRHAFREAFHQARHEHRHHHARPRPSPYATELPEDADYQAYRSWVIERAHQARGGLVGHLIPFLGVNAFLFFINFRLGLHFPWFVFPLGGWGIGMLSHMVAVRSRQLERADVEALPETLSDSDFDLLKRYHRARASARGAVAATLSVSVFLAVVNLFVFPGFPWSAFPIGGLLIGFAASLTTYLSRRGSFRRRLKELFARGAQAPQPVAVRSLPGDSPLAEQAARIAGSILEQARKLDPAKAYLGEDLQPTLEKYVEQIRTLTRRSREVEEIMAAIPRKELKRDLDALWGKQQKTSDPSLKEEYRRAIEQIQRQSRSVEDLENQKELLDLHISNAVNSLKQMQIDLARTRGLPSVQETSSFGAIRDKTRELSEYLEDFRESYHELEQMPRLSEQERETAERLLAELKRRERPPGSGP